MWGARSHTACLPMPWLQTLADNQVPDESATFEDHDISNEFYVPILHVYWNDDLTVA